MTETPDSTNAPAKKRGGGLNSMLIADLKSMAAGMGIAGAGSMKKAQLVEAIKGAQGGGAREGAAPRKEREGSDKPARGQGEQKPAEKPAQKPTERSAEKPEKTERTEKPAEERQPEGHGQQRDPRRQQDPQREKQQANRRPDQPAEAQTPAPESKGDGQQGAKGQHKTERNKVDQNKVDKQDPRKQGGTPERKQAQQDKQGQQDKQAQNNQAQNNQAQNNQAEDDEDGGSRRNRRRRGRDRQPTARAGRNEPDTTILEDDVLVPAAGILDVLDNYAFVRTSGYLPGTDDVYLSLSMVRKYGLRRGDALVGQVRQPREGERREKFNPMVRIDTVNGAEPDASRERPDFATFTPVHPDQRLRLARSDDPVGRVIDVAAPIGKGQRGLLVTPPRTGTTTLLQSMATSITTNNPECHLMVVLVDARPEEVTDFQRVVKGEVIASTFDRQPSDHALVAELSIERAKRLVELGHDVVVLLDSITRLGRAYDLIAPGGGRVLGAGVDASAIHPTKHFFGAARNIEDGGSLTILATALVDTGSAVDELFLEELLGTANLELRFSSERAALGLVPAVDPTSSGTRHEELLLAPAEGAVVADVRRQLAAAKTQSALEKVFSGGR